MYRDGVCRVADHYYTKTIEYEDINYQLAQAEDQAAIFDGWSACLNYFDSTLPFQLSFINHRSRPESRYSVNISMQEDEYNGVRQEYVEMLENQIAKSNNGIVRTKLLTFGVNVEDLSTARARLERVEADIMNNFKKLGVKSAALSGLERLELLHGQLHPGGNDPFRFSWDMIPKTGLSTKDFIAPTSFDFRFSRLFRVGTTWGAASYLQILASELSDKLLAELLELDAEMTITLHVQTVDQAAAVKAIKAKVSDIDKMKVEEQKKAVRSGYDMDIIPSDLATFGNEAKNLLQDLQSRNERMFLLTFLVVNMADTKRKLENDIFAAAGIAQKYNCALTRLDYQQEAGLMSSIPLGENLIPIQRGLTTSSTAIFIPFITQELFQTGAALYYGLNALSNNMILCDRKQLKNPNGLILGTPGSGKSFAAKREITNAFLITDDDIFICDPEAEYFALVKRLGGQVIRLSPTGKGMDGTPQYVNPMDMNLNYSEDDSPLALKSDFILSLCELVIGGKEGLQPVDKTVIDRAVRNVYRDYLADPVPEKMPILGDLYNELLKQPEPEAARIAAALELYVSGSLNVFNHRTNVELSNRLVCFDIKQLGKQLKKLGMLIVQDQIWNRVTINRAEKKSTRYYMDEFHLLLKEEQTAAYSVEIWKRFRKWGGKQAQSLQSCKWGLCMPS
ncbi:MAG: conjugal transfer protein TraE [Clostridioides difficile]|nr:conjugal transfer protein TraE [Clostridioides difficile]